MIVSLGIWDKHTVNLLVEKTGYSTPVLWDIIKAQHEVECEIKPKTDWVAVHAYYEKVRVEMLERGL